jgi:hypothetical protein
LQRFGPAAETGKKFQNEKNISAFQEKKKK